MASFPLFPCFPVEIQCAVWAFATARDPEPEVCLVWPARLECVSSPVRGYDDPVLPFIVDTDWPAVVHVCRIAREAAFKSGAVRLRYSPVAGFAVPYRHFMPAIDTLYCGRYQYIALCWFLNRPENANIAQDLRHLALEISASISISDIAVVIRKRAIYLRTLSLVLPGTMNLSSPAVSFLHPARRCRLRNFPDDTLDEITMAYIPFLRPGETQPMPLRNYLDRSRAGLDRHIRDWSVGGDDSEGTAWSTKEDSFSRLEITAQTFVEYHGTGRTEGNQEEEQWVEVCKDRLLDESGMAPWPRLVRAEDRKNPEEYRVLDDDSRMYTMEELTADVKRDHPEYTGFYAPNAGLGD